MRTGDYIALFALAALGASTGCLPRQAGFPEVKREVEERSGATVLWNHDSETREGESLVRELLGAPLGADGAVQVALLNNPELQASFDELGIARGALSSASRPQNPELEGELGFVAGEDRPDLGFSITQSLSSLLLLPLRRAAARSELEATKLKAAGEALDLAYRTRTAFYDHQESRQLLEVAELVLDATAAS